MLHTQTVEPGTFSVLKDLIALPALANFSLVGGTALSLLYGHRSSKDASLILKNDKTSTINEIIPNDFSSIKIIPNPSYGSFVIESLISDHNKFNLKILNHIGNTVYTQEKINSPSIEINIGNYAKGIYFLYITDNETIIFTEKLIIQ